MLMKTVVIIMGHGSKDAKWCASFEAFVSNINSPLVTHCYMSINSPTLESVVAGFVEKGLNKFKVIPYFMASGGHVDHDIPVLVQKVKELYPGLDITLLPPLGESASVVAGMLSVIEGALN